MRIFSRRLASKVHATKLRSFRLRFELLEARQMLAAADLTGWAGLNHQSAPNDFEVISSTSSGGTFDGRRFGAGEAAAYLADTALLTTGGAALPDLTRTTSGGFSATGTLTFDASANSNIVDPVFYYGFFDNENLSAGAFGFSIADQTATSFRFRATAGTTQGTTTVLGDGTYTYNIDVNNAASGANTVRVRLFSGATNVVNATVAIPGTLALAADSFGFLQPLAGSEGTPADQTFSMTVSNINYTGETQVAGTPPAQPTGLAATVVSSSQINLSWNNVLNETGYELQRATNSAFTAGLVTSTTVADDVTDSATGLAASTTYWFRVRAVNAAGASSYSTAVSATTQAGVPAQPTGLAASVVSSSQIDLAWIDVATETSYEVQRAPTSAFGTGTVTLPANAANDTTISATGLSASTTYWFRVRAVNAAGASSYSTAVSATTPVASSTFYIDDTGSDTGAGTLASPWKSMAKALQSAPTGSTVLMLGGDYGSQDIVLAAPGNTNEVTFKPFDATSVTISGDTRWENVNHVRLENVRITNRFKLYSTSDIELVGNEITGSSAGQRLWIHGTEGMLIEDNNFHHLTSANAIIFIRFLSDEPGRGTKTANDLTIRNNTFSDINDGDAMQINMGRNVLIEGNTFVRFSDFNNTTGNHTDAIQLLACWDTVINANFMGGGGEGDTRVLVAPKSGTTEKSLRLTISNNVMVGANDWLLQVQHTDDLVIVNNTIWGPSSAVDKGLTLASCPDVIVVNNIIRNFKIIGNVTFADRRNNLINNLSDLENRGLFSGEFVGTPTFVNPTGTTAQDYKLTASSQGRNAGVSNFSEFVALDFEGALRDPAPDLGAFEFFD